MQIGMMVPLMPQVVVAAVKARVAMVFLQMQMLPVVRVVIVSQQTQMHNFAYAEMRVFRIFAKIKFFFFFSLLLFLFYFGTFIELE